MQLPLTSFSSSVTNKFHVPTSSREPSSNKHTCIEDNKLVNILANMVLNLDMNSSSEAVPDMKVGTQVAFRCI